MTNSTLDREIEHRLAEHQVRYTSGRRTVISALARADGPMSASELHDQVSPIPLSSLYRTLAVFEEAGVLIPHFGSVTRYELAEWLTGHHHHLVCIDCGSVDDVELPSAVEASVGTLVDTIADQVGFTPLDHTLEIEGRCQRCA